MLPIINYLLIKEEICVVREICDTIKLRAPEMVCDLSQPVVITAHKNPQCKGKIDFIFDASAVSSSAQINDTTLSLSFRNGYTGWVYARSAACPQLLDSAKLVVNSAQPAINLGTDTLFCPGKNYLLRAYNPLFKSYQWQDGSTDSSFLVTTGGTYFVTATDYCGRLYADTIRFEETHIRVDLGRDSTICINEEIILDVEPDFLNYTWLPEYRITFLSPSRVRVKPEVNTFYTIRAEVFAGCYLSDTVGISVASCQEYIRFPTGFTPNGDGLNDQFRPLLSGAFERYELSIYNRMGKLVFRTTDKTSGWTGEFNDKLQDMGVYVWQCRYRFYNQPDKLIKGTLSLIR